VFCNIYFYIPKKKRKAVIHPKPYGRGPGLKEKKDLGPLFD
jgi:hypothetical protein